MADILKIGLSALLTQQRALAVTSNNIANASTPGYSRQRIELGERAAQRLGSGFVGTGVDAVLVRRLSDDILAQQLRSASSSFHRSDVFSTLSGTIDNLLADTGTGLNITLQSFVNAAQDASDDPASSQARQVLLSEADNLISRFQMFDRRLDEVAREVSTRLTNAATEINALGQNIADLNQQILTYIPCPPPAA